MPAETDWREAILAHFSAEVAAVSPVTVALDPDGLLLEQRVLDRLRGAGFELMLFDDPVGFRLSYESLVRGSEEDDRGRASIVHAKFTSSDELPYDVLAIARPHQRILRFGVADVFPKLSPRVIDLLDRADFDALWSGYARSEPDQLGERATMDFILRHVFRLAPEMIGDVPALLRALLELHHGGRSLPEELTRHFVDQLHSQGRFQGWPLTYIVPRRDAFLAFLQERWPRYLEKQVVNRNEISEGAAAVGYSAGPDELPFGHDSVRVYVDTFFLEGLLAPVTPPSGLPREKAWYQVGVIGASASERTNQLPELSDRVRDRVPSQDASYRDWLGFASIWGEWLASALAQDGVPASGNPVYRDQWLIVQRQFQQWLLAHFGSLYSLSYLPTPPVVHQIPQFVRHATGSNRCALIVVDGMSFCQWTILRDWLQQQGSGYQLDERATFAWIPTITPLSRQALFSGAIPLHFAESIEKTDRDERRWQSFWGDHGVPRQAAPYAIQRKKEPPEAFLARIRDAAADPRSRALGSVISTVDQAMHGMPIGLGGLQALVRDWVEAGHFGDIISALLDHEFSVWVTADHGNTQATGMGRLVTGELSEGGERVHRFSEEIHRANAHRWFPDSISWPTGNGLPGDYLPLIAPLDRAFTNPGTATVTHGGLTVEEVIVPFVRISRAH